MPNLEGISTNPFALSLNGASTPEAKQAKTREMAREFEATFLSTLLKEMRQPATGEDGIFPGDSSDIQGGLFDLYLGRHLAEAGGIGIANSILRSQDSRPPAAIPNSPLAPTNDRVTGSAPGGNILRTPDR